MNFHSCLIARHCLDIQIFISIWSVLHFYASTIYTYLFSILNIFYELNFFYVDQVDSSFVHQNNYSIWKNLGLAFSQWSWSYFGFSRINHAVLLAYNGHLINICCIIRGINILRSNFRASLVHFIILCLYQNQNSTLVFMI
jgi:hypothetical protein